MTPTKSEQSNMATRAIAELGDTPRACTVIGCLTALEILGDLSRHQGTQPRITRLAEAAGAVRQFLSSGHPGPWMAAQGCLADFRVCLEAEVSE